MKTITSRQMASIKRVAMNVNPLVVKKNKLYATIEKCQKEIKALVNEIDLSEGGVIAITGYKSEDLVKKVTTKLDKYDKEGKQLTKTEYIPTDRVVYNENTKMYDIIEFTTKIATCDTENTENFNTETL